MEVKEQRVLYGAFLMIISPLLDEEFDASTVSTLKADIHLKLLLQSRACSRCTAEPSMLSSRCFSRHMLTLMCIRAETWN